MSDFETRLTEALTSGAEEAPDSEGLAAGARTRVRTRRRTRYAVGAVVAVAILAVPVGISATGDEGGPDQSPVATDPTDEAPGGWHTVEHDGVLVEVPGGWERLDTSSCEFDFVRFGPRGADPCTYDHEGLAFFGSATFDPRYGPGLRRNPEVGWGGYVYAGDWAVHAQSALQERGMRILGTARQQSQEAPDLSAGFRTVSSDGLSIDVPADWQWGALAGWCRDPSVPGWVEQASFDVVSPGCRPLMGYGVRFGFGATGEETGFTEQHGSPFPEGSWAGVAIAPDENGKPVGFVQVVAPTQGLAELIGGSLRAE